MRWFKGAATVTPDDCEELYEERRGVSGWIKRHPVIASVGITFTILGIITAIVVPVTCSVHGCPPKKAETPVIAIYQGAPLRLVVSFLKDVDINDLVPPLLKQYTSRVRMALSSLQILEAVDESVLNLVLAEIQKRTDIEFVVRDFALKAPSVLGALSGGSSGRRSLQQTLNDPGLSSAYWFSRINVTGAWQQLGVNVASPQAQTSDVIIAVTDSGALVDHPDLIGSWWNNPLETDDNLNDDDGNTFIDDFYGACFAGTTCSPTSSGGNLSRCGIGRNTSSWNGIIDRTTHGTKIAGVIGANPNNGIGLAGVAPNLRQMILKVTDESLDPANPPYAFSDVVRAVDYAYGKGARIFSMSFGANAKTSMNAFNKPGLDAAAVAYKNLFLKYNNALFVSAAGNEWTNLDDWRRANYTYSPCMVDTPNSLCVGGTTINDTIFYTYVMNQDVGTNFGATTVDMGAPGMNIYTTDTAYNNFYSVVSGTSFSTPMTAAVAGLVLAALGGQSRATSQTPQIIKNILMTSGDVIPSLQGRYKSTRRLNAGNAVAAAMTLAATNRTVMKLARTFESISSTVTMQAVEYNWFRQPAFDGTFDGFGLGFLDYYVRSQPTSNFNTVRYGPMTMAMATTMLRIDVPGVYSIQARTSGITPDRWQLTLGENVVVWNTALSTNGTADLIFPDAGFYNFTLWFAGDYSTVMNFVWQVPGNTTWGNPNMLWVLNENPPSSRFYDPNISPKPALWHVVWNESATFDAFNDRGYFVSKKEPRLYRTMQATTTDFSFATGTDLRTALYGSGFPSNNQTVVYGYARANLRPLNFTTGISFRLQGPHTRLYINDKNIFDFWSDTQLMVVSPCVLLRNNTAHEIYFYFAARLNSSNPVGLTWAPCTLGAAVPTGLSGAYSSFSTSLATNYFWQTSNITGLPRGFRCDAWPGNLSISNVGSTPQYGTPPTLTWMYPRDCPAAYSNGAGECRMSTRLNDLFPSLTWPVWNIRCFTYYAGSIKSGLTGAAVLGGPIFQHLAGVRVYDQFGDGNSFTNFAPYSTRFASNLYQLYVIEWVALGQQWNCLAAQTIWDGVLAGGGAADTLTSNSTAMILPASARANLAWADVTSA